MTEKKRSNKNHNLVPRAFSPAWGQWKGPGNESDKNNWSNCNHSTYLNQILQRRKKKMRNKSWGVFWRSCFPVSFQSYRLYILIQGPSSYSDITYFYSELLAHINPLLNPLVYVLFNKHYRASIKELFIKCRCKITCCRFGQKFYLKGKQKKKKDCWTRRCSG